MTSPLAENPDRARPAGDDNQQTPISKPTGNDRATATTHPNNQGNGEPREQVVEHPQGVAGLDEASPLLSPASHEEDGFLNGRPDDPKDEFQATKSIWYLILLTISIGGLQIAWSVEMSAGSPYLLSLGISKSLMALVWIAGPLSGTLVQPYVGMLSDNCRISWGKRKPFMLIGTFATVVSLMVLAWTKEIVGGFLGLFGAEPDSQFVKVSIIVTAVLWVYILDFAINTGKATIDSSRRFQMANHLPPFSSPGSNSCIHRRLRANPSTR